MLEKFQTIPMSLCVSVILGIDSSISIAVATATLGYFRVLGGKILVFILRGSWGGFQCKTMLARNSLAQNRC